MTENKSTAFAQHTAAATPATIDMRFLTLAELRERAPPQPAWLWDGYLAAGAVSLLAGKPKAGKSTLALAVSAAIASTEASVFLGSDVLNHAVVYVSEEGAGTLKHKLPDDDAAIYFLTRDSAWPKPDWPQLVSAAVAHAEKVSAKLLVIDTAAYWTALPADREKDAGAVQEAMLPLVQATRSGLAVLLIHHARKAGGEDGDAVRGSSGWAATVDTIIELERVDDEQAPKNQRLLLALGRYPQTPGPTLIDHDPATGGWAVIGTTSSRRDARGTSARAALLNALPESEPGITRQQIEQDTGLNWQRLNAPIRELTDAGQITRSGAGKKGDPHHYHKLSTDPVHDSRTATDSNGAQGSDFSSVHPYRGTEETASHTEPPPDSNGQQNQLTEEAQTVTALIDAFDATEETR